MVDDPFGFTEPVSVMLVVEHAEADPVDAVGAAPARREARLDPVLDPDEFDATSRKM